MRRRPAGAAATGGSEAADAILKPVCADCQWHLTHLTASTYHGLPTGPSTQAWRAACDAMLCHLERAGRKPPHQMPQPCQHIKAVRELQQAELQMTIEFVQTTCIQRNGNAAIGRHRTQKEWGTHGSGGTSTSSASAAQCKSEPRLPQLSNIDALGITRNGPQFPT